MSYTGSSKRINYENGLTLRHPLTTHIIVGDNDSFHMPYLNCRNLGTSQKPVVIPESSDQYQRIQSLTGSGTAADKAFDWYCYRRGFNLKASQVANKATALANAEAAWHPTESGGTYTQVVTFTVPSPTWDGRGRYLIPNGRYLSVCFSERGEEPITIKKDQYSSIQSTNYNNVIDLNSQVTGGDELTVTIIATEPFKLACCSIGIKALFTDEQIVSVNTSLRSNLDYTSEDLPVSLLDAYIGITDTSKSLPSFFARFTELPLGTEINLWQGYQDALTVAGTTYYGEMVNRKFYITSGDEFCETDTGTQAHLEAKDSVALMVGKQTGDVFMTKDGTGYCIFPTYYLEDYDVQDNGHSFYRLLDLGYNPADKEAGTNPSTLQKAGRYPFILSVMNQAARSIGRDISIRTSKEGASQAGSYILDDGSYLTSESHYGPYDNRTINLGSTSPIPPGEDFLAYIPSSAPRTMLQHMMNIFGKASQQIYRSSSTTSTATFQPVYVDAGIPTITAGAASSVLTISKNDVTDIKTVKYKEYESFTIKNGVVKNYEGTIQLDNMVLLAEKSSRGLGSYQVVQQGGGQMYSDFWIKVTDSNPDSYGSYNDTTITERMLGAVNAGNATVYERWIDRRSYSYPYTFEGSQRTQTKALRCHLVWDIGQMTIYFTGAIPTDGQRNIQIYGQPFKMTEAFETVERTLPVRDGEDASTDYTMYMTGAGYNLGHAVENDNIGVQFTWRGDPRLQPRDVIYFNNVYYTIESIETKYEEGGTLSTITARKGYV